MKGRTAITFCAAGTLPVFLWVYRHARKAIIIANKIAAQGQIFCDRDEATLAGGASELVEVVSGSFLAAGSSTETGAIKRYPRRGKVSINRGLSESSLMAARSFFRITFRLPSKSTYVPSG